jgi:DNA-binding beta-propeller fold protein YncE
VTWSWRPPVGTPGWRLPTDARLRSARSGLVMLTTDSDGYVGEVAYPSGKTLWSANVGVGPNPHTAELLPDGNVVVAASDGNWLRIYAVSQRGAKAAHYKQVSAQGAHGLLWDPARRMLWVLDHSYLARARVGGSAAAPTLTWLGRSRLPDPDGGHDVQPVHGDTNRLWVSTGTHVYQYDKTTGKFSVGYTGAAQINRFAVKSIGQNPATGQLLETTPNTTCTVGDWCTDTVDFFRPTDHRTRLGTGIYKARWWSPDYQ